MKNKLLVVTSPHLKDPVTTSNIMLTVVVALIPDRHRGDFTVWFARAHVDLRLRSLLYHF